MSNSNKYLSKGDFLFIIILLDFLLSFSFDIQERLLMSYISQDILPWQGTFLAAYQNYTYKWMNEYWFQNVISLD